MIQRKQTLWLLIASLLNFCVLFFDVYRWHQLVNGVDTPMQLSVTGHFPLMAMVVVTGLLPLVAIFLFSQRKRQINITMLSIVAVICFFAMLVYSVSELGKQTPPPTSGSYYLGSMLPIASILFLIMAIIAIRKDEKLVKSMDRLR